MSRTAHKVVLSATIAAVALGAAGMGTYAAWSTSKSTASQTVASGTFALSLSDPSIAVSNIAPGDTIERYMTLTNSASTDYSGIKAAVTTDATSALLDATTKSLRFSVTTCPHAFATAVKPAVDAVADDLQTTVVETAAAKPAVAVGDCAHPTTQVAATTTQVASNTDYAAAKALVEAAGYGALQAGESSGIRFNIAFPSTTGSDAETQVATATTDYNTYAGKSAAFTVAFTASQRAGAAK